MNKEELLKKLQDIKEQMSTTDIKDVQIEEVAQNLSVRRKLEQELELLLDKVGDDTNYTRSTAELTERTKTRLTNSVTYADTQLAQCEVDRFNCNNNIRIIDSEVENAHYLISEGNKEIEVLEGKINSLATADNEKSKVLAPLYAAQIDKTKLAIADLENTITNFEKDKEVITKQLKDVDSRVSDITKDKEDNQAALAEIGDRVSDSSYIDEASKQEDKDRILALQRMVSLNAKTDSIPYEFASSLDKIIEGVNNGTLTDEQVSERLTVFKENISDNYFIKDNQNRDKKLDEIREQISYYQGETSALNDKLNDKDNYQLSIFAIEAMEDEKARINGEILSDENELQEISNLKASNDARIEELENQIKGNQNEQDALGRKWRSLGDDIEPKVEKDFTKQINSLRKVKDGYNKELDTLKEKAFNLDAREAAVKNTLKNDKNLLKAKEVEPIVDTLGIKTDTDKLNSYNEILDGLKQKEEFLSHNLEYDIILLLEDLSKTKDKEVAPVIAPIVEPTIEPEVQAAEPIIPTVGTYNPSDNTYVVPAVEAPTVEPEVQVAQPIEPTVEEAQPIEPDVPEEVVEEPIEEDKKDKKKTPVPIVMWKKAKKAVCDKIHDKEFMKKIAAGVAVVATAVAIIAATTSCQSRQTKEPEPTESPKLEDEAPEPVVTPDVGTYHPSDNVYVPPVVEEPEIKAPEVEEPEIKDPEVEEPEVKDPEIEEPEVKDPEVEEPEVKDPEVKPSEPAPDEKDVEPEQTYNVPDGATFINKTIGEDGNIKIEVVSNDGNISSGDAAQNIEDNLGLPATGNPEDFTNIIDTSYQEDGSVNVGVGEVTPTDSTLAEDIRVSAGVTDEELSQQEADMAAIIAEGGMSR